MARSIPTDLELREESVRLARSYLDRLNVWDFDGLSALVAEDFVLEMKYVAPGMPSRWEGRGTVIDLYRGMSVAILSPNLHDFWMDTLYSDPGEVVAQYRSEMRMADPNLSYGNEYISRFTIKDGKIIRFVDGFDSVRLVLGFGGTVEAPRIA